MCTVSTSQVRQLLGMLKRRTSKRFVIGDGGEEQPSWEKEEAEATAVLPANLLQKFQMTLDAEPEKTSAGESSDRGPEEDSRLLRPPAAASTLQ